jgi:hypothetical protein
MKKRYETVGRLNITVDKSAGKLMVMVNKKFFFLLIIVDEAKTLARRKMDEK